MTQRKIARLFVAASALVLALGMGSAQAAKHHAHAVHKHAVHETTAEKMAAKGRHTVKAPPIVIVSKPPADARDFDYRTRIQEAQDLVAKQPVLPGDMQVDVAGQLSHFVWTLAVGGASGPLQIVRMDESGKNGQG